MNDDGKKTLRCSFCGKHEQQVRRMIQGPGVRICDECVRLCMSILNDGYEDTGHSGLEDIPDKLPTPQEIKEVLDQYVESGDIEIVYEQFCDNWSPEIALQYAEDALTANNDDIQAILCANDNMANGAIQALTNKNLQGKVVVTGQDADLLGCQNIVKGFQSLTVYKPSSALSKASMEAAFALIEGKEVETNSVMDNGYKDVPTIALESFAVDKDNIDDTIIADGYQTKEEVYETNNG